MIHHIDYYLCLDDKKLYMREIYDVTPEDYANYYVRDKNFIIGWREIDELPKEIVDLTKEQFKSWDSQICIKQDISGKIKDHTKDFPPCDGVPTE